MDSAGSAYLYTLATLSVTLAGFTVIVLVFRQVLGGEVTRFDSFIMRSFLLLGIMLAVAAMVPGLLALWHIPDLLLWRYASGFLAGFLLAFGVMFPGRRRAASGGPMPTGPRIFVGVLLIAAVAMFLNSTGIVAKPGIGPYATALTVVFLMFGISFAYLVGLPLRRSPDKASSAAEK